MIIFLKEDGAYRSWVTHHRQGYVVDGRWKKEFRRLVLHRATCGEIRIAPGKSSHAMTGGRFKACSASHEELVAWAGQCADATPELCSQCQPTVLPAMDPADSHHKLSRLSAEILDYVLDVAVIHLDDPTSVYRLTISDIAGCLGKSAAQLTDALRRLTEEGLITVVELPRRARDNVNSRMVLPTAGALRTLPAFSELADEQLAGQLAILQTA